MGRREVYTIEGNLLTSDCNVILHQANCFGVMGAGIAKQIKALYPAVYHADRELPIPFGEERLGRTSHAWNDGPYGRLLVVNLYGQLHYGTARGDIYPNHEFPYYHFKQALYSTLERMEELGRGYKIGLPHGVGCGLAGGNWEDVYSVLHDAVKVFDRDLYLYRL